MRNLFILRVAPASCKSTWIKENELEPYTISTDSLRLMYQSPVTTVEGERVISQNNDKEVWNLLTELLERRMEKGVKLARSGDKKAKAEYEIMERVKSHLENNLPVRTLDLNEDEEAFVKSLFLITSKPVLYACNVSEDDVVSGDPHNEYVKKVEEYAKNENSGIVIVSAKIEEELSGLEDEEKQEMLGEYGLTESGLDQLIREGYKLLGLISYLTAGVQEVRAWTIKQ